MSKKNKLTSEGHLRRLNRIGDLHVHLRDLEFGVQGRVLTRLEIWPSILSSTAPSSTAVMSVLDHEMCLEELPEGQP